MFDWFWEFLYSISKTIFRLIDGMMRCANMICGIEKVKIDGEETDFLSHLLFGKEVGLAFRVSALLATILLVIFTVFMIIRSITKEKAEGTPAQIAVKAFKTLLMFFLVPALTVAFMMLGNAFIKAIYSATIQSSSSIGAFLFSSFAEDGGMSHSVAEQFRTGVLDYNDTSLVSEHMSISDYPSVFSLIVALVILFGIGSAMLVFVDRVLSIVILYIAAPISISTSVLDDGARFKLWRDQFIAKFIMGYGMILAINVYALVCSLVMNPEFFFFEDDEFVNLIMKLLIIAGGALTMQKSMALAGNLVASGAGSNELRDNAFTAGRIASKTFGVIGTVTGVRAVKSILSDSLSLKSRDIASKIVGVSDKQSHGGKSRNADDSHNAGGNSGAQNNEKPSYGSNPESTKDAISNNGFKTSDWGTKTGGNGNNNQLKNNKGGMLNKAIDNGKTEGQGNQNNSKQEGDK